MIKCLTEKGYFQSNDNQVTYSECIQYGKSHESECVQFVIYWRKKVLRLGIKCRLIYFYFKKCGVIEQHVHQIFLFVSRDAIFSTWYSSSQQDYLVENIIIICQNFIATIDSEQKLIITIHILSVVSLTALSLPNLLFMKYEIDCYNYQLIGCMGHGPESTIKVDRQKT